MRRKYFVCARKSACEVAAAIDLALDLEVVDLEHAEKIAGLAARLRALLVGLLR